MSVVRGTINHPVRAALSALLLILAGMSLAVGIREYDTALRGFLPLGLLLLVLAARGWMSGRLRQSMSALAGLLLVLVLVLLPEMYGGGNTRRAMVTSGLNLATTARIAVQEYFDEHGEFPGSNAEAGIPEPESISSRYVSSIRIESGGRIVISYGGDAGDRVLTGKTLNLAPGTDSGGLEWQCKSEVPPRYLPERCQP